MRHRLRGRSSSGKSTAPERVWFKAGDGGACRSVQGFLCGDGNGLKPVYGDGRTAPGRRKAAELHIEWIHLEARKRRPDETVSVGVCLTDKDLTELHGRGRTPLQAGRSSMSAAVREMSARWQDAPTGQWKGPSSQTVPRAAEGTEPPGLTRPAGQEGQDPSLETGLAVSGKVKHTPAQACHVSQRNPNTFIHKLANEGRWQPSS